MIARRLERVRFPRMHAERAAQVAGEARYTCIKDTFPFSVPDSSNITTLLARPKR